MFCLWQQEVFSLECNDLNRESARRLSEYVGALFGRGELFDVVAIAQKELEEHPLNLDMVIYRACACLVLQVSCTIQKNEELVEHAIEQLALVSQFMELRTDYDGSLGFYMALGQLVLGHFETADQMINALQPVEEEEEALSYYENRKIFWKTKLPLSFRHFESPLPS